MERKVLLSNKYLTYWITCHQIYGTYINFKQFKKLNSIKVISEYRFRDWHSKLSNGWLVYVNKNFQNLLFSSSSLQSIWGEIKRSECYEPWLLPVRWLQSFLILSIKERQRTEADMGKIPECSRKQCPNQSESEILGN